MKIIKFAAISLGLMVFFGIDSAASAQGRGNGNGGNRPAQAGPPAGAGVDRGLGNASQRSGGRADDGWGTASERSNGRRDSGIDRARHARERAMDVNDRELNRYRGISKKLDATPEELRARYEAALLANPDLRYGQFVSAHVVADNLNGRYPNVTSDAILLGYVNGDSLGRTLRNLGMTREEAKAAERNAEAAMKEAKRRNQ